MAFDIYVGTATRYLSGNWENVAQQHARETGTGYKILRPDSTQQIDPKGEVLDTAEVLTQVLEWQKQLSQEIKNNELPIPTFDWNEKPNEPYFTDRPTWEGYGALMLWAAYDEEGNEKLEKLPEDFFNDPVYLKVVQKDETKNIYPVMTRSQIWLPVDFARTLQTIWVNDNEMVFGSVQQLLRELEILNSKSWQANDEQFKKWRYDFFEKDDPLEKVAKFAFAVFRELAQKAAENKSVMILDY